MKDLRVPLQVSVMLRAVCPDPGASYTAGRPFCIYSQGSVSFSASGVAVDPVRGLVVTHASFVSPFLTYKDPDNNPLEFSKVVDGVRFQMLQSEGAQKEAGAQWQDLELISVREAPGVRSCVSQLTQESSMWSVGWPSPNGSTLPRADLATLSRGFSEWNVDIGGLALLRVSDPASLRCVPQVTLLSRDLNITEPVNPVFSPFGVLSTRNFCSHVTSAVVSNMVFPELKGVVSKRPSLLLFDGGVFPGAEGGGVFSDSGQLAGLIVPALRHRDTPVDLNVMIPAHLIHATFLAHLGHLAVPSQASPSPTMAIVPQPIDPARRISYEDVKRIQSAVVMVNLSGAWGSGVIISPKGHVLTNAHVVKPAVQSSVPVPFRPTMSEHVRIHVGMGHSPRRWIRDVRLLYASYSQWDLAILKLPERMEPYPFFEIMDRKESLRNKLGGPVYAIGYGLFEPIADVPSTVTSGVVSNVITTIVGGERSDAMLQCSAAIHRGCSGGVVVDAQDGSLLGIVSNNIRHTTGSGSRIIPQLNMCIPVTALAPVRAFIDREAPEELKPLLTATPDLTNIWTLNSKATDLPKSRSKL